MPGFAIWLVLAFVDTCWSTSSPRQVATIPLTDVAVASVADHFPGSPSPALLLTTYNFLTTDGVFVVRDLVSVVKGEGYNTVTLTKNVKWPNQATMVPLEVFSTPAMLVAGGFLVPHKTPGMRLHMRNHMRDSSFDVPRGCCVDLWDYSRVFQCQIANLPNSKYPLIMHILFPISTEPLRGLGVFQLEALLRISACYLSYCFCMCRLSVVCFIWEWATGLVLLLSSEPAFCAGRIILRLIESGQEIQVSTDKDGFFYHEACILLCASA